MSWRVQGCRPVPMSAQRLIMKNGRLRSEALWGDRDAAGQLHSGVFPLNSSNLNATNSNPSSSLNPSSDAIVIRGARTHNLKNISCDIPHGKLTVVSGDVFQIMRP